jgi:hypothetical protein
MSQDIYRKQAIERLSSPDQLDQLMPITRPRAWIALAGVGLLLLAAVLWSIFGSIQTTVEGYGTLDRLDGISHLRAPISGTIASLMVEVDDPVKQGETVAFVVPSKPVGAKPVPMICPADGRVLAIQIVAEQSVDEAALVLSIESPQQRLSSVLYVAIPDGYQVEAGMLAKVLPATSTKHEAAYILGRVAEAGRYPAEQQTQWNAASQGTGPMLRVLVEFDSSFVAPEIYSGTPCTGTIAVEERRPIEILLTGLAR